MQLAQPAVQLLGRQTTYRGGWPQGFISDPCSGEASMTCQTHNIYTLNCCPSGQTCSKVRPPYCCPTEEDYGTTVYNFPAYANSTWNMYELQDSRGAGDIYYFCCPQNMVGITPSTGHPGICQKNGVNIPQSMLATSVTQFGGTGTTGIAGEPTQEQPGGGGSGDIRSPSGDDNSSNIGNTGSDNNDNNVGDDGTAAGSGSSSGGSGGGGILAGAIVGIVIGSLPFFALAITLVLWTHRRSLRKNPPCMGVGAFQNQPPHDPQRLGCSLRLIQYCHVVALKSCSKVAPRLLKSRHMAPFQTAPETSRYIDNMTHSPQGAAPVYSPPLHVS